MSKQPGKLQWKWALGAALLAALLVTGVALADFITVDTNDAVLDGDWTGRTVFITDPAGDQTGGPQFDLLEAYMAEGPTSTDYLYFLTQVNANTFPNVVGFSADLDCDDDGNFAEATDRKVFYQAGTVFIQNGLGVSVRGGVATDGERVSFGSGTNNAAEFRAPLADLATCGTATTLGVSFTVTDSTGGAPVVADTSTPRRWNVPTAIELVSVEGRSGSSLPLLLAAVAAILLLGLSFYLRRRRA